MKKSLLTILILSANHFLSGCADDQARQQIADTNQRLNQIQQNVVVLDNKLTNQKVLDLLNQITDLQSQISQLNGRVANLENGQNTNQGDMSQQLQSLDMRISALESANGVSQPATAKFISNNNQELQAAIAKIKANDVNGAIIDLKRISNGSDKASATSARYYLSVAYVANNQYKEAITEANNFIRVNPNNKNAPDALRVIFISQSQLKQSAAANATAKKLWKMYPNSEAAKKVSAQLQ